MPPEPEDRYRPKTRTAAAVVKLLKHIEDFLGWTAGKAGHMSRAILCLDDFLNFLAK